MTQLMSIKDKLILVRNAQHEIDVFFKDVIRDYVNRSKTFKQSGFFEHNPNTHEYVYHCHDHPYYGIQPFFNIVFRNKEDTDRYEFKAPTAILDANNDGWCRDWKITLSRFIHTEDLANGHDPIPYREE